MKTKLKPGQCPKCEKKGVLFRHPTHNIRANGYGAWLCMVCTMPEHGATQHTYGDSYFNGYIHKHVEDEHEEGHEAVSEWFYNYTPEMSRETYVIIVALYGDRYLLNLIRRGLGLVE